MNLDSQEPGRALFAALRIALISVLVAVVAVPVAVAQDSEEEPSAGSEPVRAGDERIGTARLIAKISMRWVNGLSLSTAS